MDEIEIVAYDPNWPRLFAEEKGLLEGVLPSDRILAIEHAGSTAIPGLAAKPIIDIYVAVASIEAARPALVAPIVALGYVLWAENPNRDPLFFVKGMPPYGQRRTHHVHALEHASEARQRPLLFRDYLRYHPDAAEAYRLLKLDLAVRYRRDREAYTSAKDSFVGTIIERARAGP